MKTIGMLGGMSWESTASYYKAINQGVKSALGGLHSAKICMYSVDFDEIEKAISIPVLHIADATAERLISDKIKRAGLLGTRFTMDQDFYKGRLTEKFNIDVVVPEAEEQEIIHNIIFSELCLGKISENSKDQFIKIINSLHVKGAEAIILGCTEIASLIQQKHTPVPLYNTTEIHAAQAVKLATSE